MTPLSPGFTRIHLQDVGSTNDHARSLAAQGAADGTVITADRQTTGRARRGRAWESRPGNLFATLILRPARPLAESVQLGFVASVALRAALASLLPDGAVVHCKWPNDILIGGRKASGMLLESGPLEEGVPAWVLLGLGVNVLTHPDGTEYPATSLAAMGGSATADAVAAAFLDRFAAWRGLWESHGFEPVRQEWWDHASGRGQPICVRLPGASLHGTFVDLDQDGALVLHGPEGDRRVTYGDVFPAAA